MIEVIVGFGFGVMVGIIPLPWMIDWFSNARIARTPLGRATQKRNEAIDEKAAYYVSLGFCAAAAVNKAEAALQAEAFATEQKMKEAGL